MSGTINKVLLIGNLGENPEVRYLENKTVVARFSIATEGYFIDKESQKQKKIVDWHRIVCWNQLAIFVDNQLKKGMKVYIEGKLKSKSWINDRDYTVFQNEIIAESIQLIAIPSSNDTQNKSHYPTDDKINPTPLSNKELFNFDDDDESPF